MTDLLKPRFEVIADYPNNDFGPIGTILDRDWGFYPEGSKENITFLKISDYPHLFRKLNWWEKREESEMPKYLKIKEYKNVNGKLVEKYTSFYKIEKWDMVNMMGYIDIKNRKTCDILCWNPEYTYQPATEEEYLNSIK